MINAPQASEFSEKIYHTFVQLGFKENIAKALSEVMVPTKIDGATVFLKCTNTIYQLFTVEKHKEILAVVKSVWGPEFNFSFSEEVESYSKNIQKHQKPSNPPAQNTIFDFDTPPSAAKPQPQSVSLFGTHKVDSSTAALEFGLNPDFTFSSFIRGPSNSIAFSACESVSLQPGRLNNPVFIYGGSGLGKTHLLHAVGNEILNRHPNWKVLYIQSSDFVTDFIQAIRHGHGNIFRNRFSECDLLLVDDVQFLENKEQTQHEFFHIFNLLCQKRKQVVLTSDKYPKDIPTLEERLRSRFLQGLLADIEPPSFEERLAIIESTAEKISLRLTPDVASLVATNVKTNIRELKGTLNNLLLRQTVSSASPTVQDVESVLRSIVKVQRQTLDICTIQKVVASFYDIKLNDLTSSSKAQKLVFPRHVAMYLAREMINANLVEIATAFSRKDHTTVINACDNVRKKIDTDASTRSSVSEIRRRLEHMS